MLKGAAGVFGLRFGGTIAGWRWGPEDAACEVRRTDTGERFFVRCDRQGGFAERKAMKLPRHDFGGRTLVRFANLRVMRQLWEEKRGEVAVAIVRPLRDQFHFAGII
jgi:hypothetical protein